MYRSRPSILVAAGDFGSIPLRRSDVGGVVAELLEPPAALGDADDRHVEHPRSTSPTSAGNVSSLARSPVAPKMTSAYRPCRPSVGVGSICGGYVRSCFAAMGHLLL